MAGEAGNGHDNLRSALAWGVEAGDAGLSQRTAAALTWLWIIRRHVTEGAEWFNRVLATDGDSPHARASALVHGGFMSTIIQYDDLEACLARVREGLSLFEQQQDWQGVGTGQTYEAEILWFQRDFEASRRSFAEIQTAMRTAGFEWGDAFCSYFLGSAGWFLGDLTQARGHYTRGLEIFQRVGDLALIVWILLPMANISLESGDLEQATALYHQALPMMDDLGDRHGVGAVLLGLGLAAHRRGEREEAQRLLVEAQTNLREGGGGQALSWPISNVLVDTRTHDLLVEANAPVSGRAGSSRR